MRRCWKYVYMKSKLIMQNEIYCGKMDPKYPNDLRNKHKKNTMKWMRWSRCLCACNTKSIDIFHFYGVSTIRSTRNTRRSDVRVCGMGALFPWITFLCVVLSVLYPQTTISVISFKWIANPIWVAICVNIEEDLGDKCGHEADVHCSVNKIIIE